MDERFVGGQGTRYPLMDDSPCTSPADKPPQRRRADGSRHQLPAQLGPKLIPR